MHIGTGAELQNHMFLPLGRNVCVRACAACTSLFAAKMLLFYNVIIKFEICTTVYNTFQNHSPMMVEKAFVLINTNDQMDDDILLDELKKMDGVSEAYKVCGIYDILVKVEAKTMD